jgi:hypothetical protein
MTPLISPDAKIALLHHGLSATPQSSTLLFRLAEALAEKGETQKAADVFRRAYLLEPIIWNGGPEVDPKKQRDEAFAMIKHGANFSSTIAALAIGEARMGHTDEVKKLVDYDCFFRDTMLDPPSGFGRDEFNEALAAEIKSELTFYGEPEEHDQAIRNGWRHNGLVRSKQPTCRAFAAAVQREVERYISDLPSSTDHPFLVSRPADFELQAWAVVSDGKSYHQSHIHPRAWASGVYYVKEPPASQKRGSNIGWLHVGPPERLGVSTDQGWAKRLVAPIAGRLILMPAYFYHYTRPMGVDEERISVAIDVVPTELATAKPVPAGY